MAANTDLFKKVARRWVGQIGAAGVADAVTTTVPLASTTNLPTGTAVVVVIDRVDSNGTSTASLEETTIGVVSGSNLVNCVRGAEGTAQAHNAGAVVEVLVTAKGINDLIDGLLVQHDQLGYHTNVTASNITASATLTACTISASAVTFSNHDPNLAVATQNFKVAGSDPKRAFYVPAAGMYGATTNGAASGQYESATNKINTKVLDFDASTEEYAWFAIPSPDYWDLSTITVKFHWTVASGSDDVIWGAAALARSNDDALDTALGTAATVTDTVITALDLHTTSATSAITVGGTPAKGDYLFIRVYRDADAGGDTLATDARLIGVTVKFGIGQYDDQ